MNNQDLLNESPVVSELRDQLGLGPEVDQFSVYHKAKEALDASWTPESEIRSWTNPDGSEEQNQRTPAGAKLAQTYERWEQRGQIGKMTPEEWLSLNGHTVEEGQSVDEIAAGPALPESTKEDPMDLSKVGTMLLSSDWVDAEGPEQRRAMAANAIEIMADALESKEGATVPREVYRDGQKVVEEVPVHDRFGRLNQAGREYLDRARQVLDAAAQNEDGGVQYNPLTESVEMAEGINELMLQRPEKGPQDDGLPDLTEWLSEQRATGEDMPTGEEDIYNAYAAFSAAKGGKTATPEEFKSAYARQTFDPMAMPEDQMIAVVDGMPVLNPKNLQEIDKMEAAISGLKGFSKGQKRIMLADYHDTLENGMGDLVNDFAAADAGVIGSIYSRPLNEDFEKWNAEGKSGIDFLRANKERMSKDSYSLWSEIPSTFRDALMATGTGALWLAGASPRIKLLDWAAGTNIERTLSKPGEAWGGLAEDSSKAYRNPDLFKIPFTDMNVGRRDLTELTGQIGSFLALGGLGSVSSKLGLTATKAAVAEGTALTAGAMAEQQVARTFGQKALGVMKAAATDPTAYLGGIQAAGMSFGRTYNQVMEQTGDDTAAYRAASIQGISDGLSALIATGVMNRVAPGAERLLGAKEGALSGSIIQNLRNRTASAAGMKEVQAALGSITPELRKQFIKDLSKDMAKRASAMGLAGVGGAADILSEGVEESLDEALSDVIEIMVDDSKSWDEVTWRQIHDNFSGYVKAGVLGAIGGGIGNAPAAANSIRKAVFTSDAQRKDFIKSGVTDRWAGIKANVEKFDQDLYAQMDGEAIRVAEVLADPNIPIEEKSRILVAAAKQQFVSTDKAAVDVPQGVTIEEPGSLEQEEREYKEGKKPSAPLAHEVLDAMGFKAPEGKEWKKDLQMDEGKEVRIGKNQIFTPLTIGGVANAAAKVQSYDPITGERGQPQYLDARQAEQALPAAHSLRKLFNEKNNEQSIDGTGDVDTWSVETAADTVATDGKVSGAESEGAGVDSDATGAGSADQASVDGSTSEGGSETTPVEAEASVADVTPEPAPKPQPTAEEKAAQKQVAERIRTVDAARDALDDDGQDFDEADRPEAAGFAQNKGRFDGDNDVWRDTKTGKVGVSPAYVDKVMADDSIEDKAGHIAQRVKDLAGIDPQPGLQAVTPVVEDKGKDEKQQGSYILLKRDQGGEKDATGGSWQVTRERLDTDAETGPATGPIMNATYVPGKGKTMSMEIGDVVAIDGDANSVLVYTGTHDGQFQFATIPVGNVRLDSKRAKLMGLANREWNQNKLTKVGELLEPHLKELLGAGPITPAMVEKFKEVFTAVMKQVAPEAGLPVFGEVVDHTGKGGHIMQAAARETANGPALVMEVDPERSIQAIRSIFEGISLGDSQAVPIVAQDVGRLLSKWVEEEQIHLLTMDPRYFTEKELKRFYREVAKENHPFFNLLESTVNERFPGRNWKLDPKDPNSLRAEEHGIYIVASELLRKLQQIRIGGSFSEQAMADARELTKAINEDSGKKGLFKTLAELLRRYSNRMRQLLQFRANRGRISNRQRVLLDRLNNEYIGANLRGDVDMVREKLSKQLETRLRTFSSGTEEEINDAAKKHTNALMELRRLPNEFVSLGLGDMLQVDDNLDLSLREPVQKYLAGTGRDLKAINEGLAALNKAGSYQKVSMEAMMAKQVMEAKEANLDFNPNEFFQWLEGKEFDPQGVMAHIVKHAPRDGFMGSNALLRAAEQEHKKVRGQIAMFEKALEHEAVRVVQGLDMSVPADRRELFRRARAVGLPMEQGDFQPGGRYPSMEVFQNAVAVATRTFADSMWLDPVSPTERPSLVDETNPGWQNLKELRARATSLSNRIIELTDTPVEPDEIAKANSRFRDADEVNRLKDRTESLERGTDMEVARERYEKFRQYLEALDEYNRKVTNLMERAVGLFDIDTRDYALYFRDTRFAGEPKPFDKATDRLEAALAPGDVFGHNYRPASAGRSLTPTDGFPRNPPKAGDATEETRQLIRNHKRQVESNAAFIGRQSRMEFAINDAMQKLPGDFNRDLYNAGAGFAFNGLVTDYERVVYESEEKAFPRFDGFDDLYSIGRKFEDLGEFDQNGLESLVSYIDKAERWLAEVRDRADPSQIIDVINGKQTPAARANVLLQPVLGELTEALENVKGLFLGHMVNHLTAAENPGSTFGSKFKRGADGKLEVRDLQQALNALRFEMAAGNRSSGIGHMTLAQEAANSAVALTRRMVKEFNNQRWQDNVEREIDRYIRDAAYVPDHPEMLELRDAKLDLITLRNLSFAFEYFQGDAVGQYWVQSAHAFELLESFRKLQRNTPEAFISGRGTKLAEGQANPEAFVQTLDDLDSENTPNVRGDTGEFGSTVDAWLNQLVSPGSTAADRDARRADVTNQGIKKALTTALMFIGYRSNGWSGNVEDARGFARDVINHSLRGTGSPVKLVEQGIAGLFPGVSPEAREALVEEFYDKNPEWSYRVGTRNDHEYNPESFVTDLLEFKTKFEMDAVQSYRVKDNDPVIKALETIETAQLPAEEREGLQRLIRKDLETGALVAYDPRAMTMYDIELTDDPLVSLLITNLPGQTYILKPTDKETVISGANVGLRVMPGKDGSPNIVVVPQSGMNSVDKAGAVAQSLKLLQQDEAGRQMIEDLAGKVRETLENSDSDHWIEQPRSAGPISDVILVSNLLTDPELRRDFDAAYAGGDTEKDFDFHADIKDTLQKTVRSLRTASNFNDAFYEDSTGNEKLKEATRYAESDGITLEEEVSLESVERDDSRDLRDFEAEQEDAGEGDAEQLEGVLDTETMLPGDSMLYNALGGLLEQSKVMNGQMAPGYFDRRLNARRILANEAPGSLAAPLFEERGRPKGRDLRAMIVGEALNLTRPRIGKGDTGKTALSWMMNATRRRTESAALLSVRVPSVKRQISNEVQRSIEKQKKENPNAPFFAGITTQVVLDDQFFEEAEATLPGLTEQMNEVVRALGGMQETRLAIINKIEAAQNVLAAPVGFDESLFEQADLESRAVVDQMADTVFELSQDPRVIKKLAQKDYSAKQKKSFAEMLGVRSMLPNPRDQRLARLNEQTAAVQQRINTLTAEISDLSVHDTTKAKFGQRRAEEQLARAEARLERLTEQTRVAQMQATPFPGGSRPGLSQAKLSNPAFMALLNFLEGARHMTKDQIRTVLENGIQKSSEEGGANAFSELIKTLAFTSDEVVNLVMGRSMTAAQKQARDQAQWEMKEGFRQLQKLDQDADRMFDTNGVSYLGRYRHVTGEKRPDGSRVAMNVSIDLVDPLTETYDGQNQRERIRNLEDWNDSRDDRRKFYVRQEALKRTLALTANDRVDQMYRKLRGQLDNYSSFNPAMMVNEAIKRVEVEDAVLKERMGEAQDVAQKAKGRGLTAEALSFITDPTTMAFTRQQGRLKRHLLPENRSARESLIGKLMEDENGPMALVPADAKQRLIEAFPGRISPTNVNRTLEGITLRALADERGYPSFMDSANAPTGKFRGTFQTGKGMTIEEAGEAFAGKFEEGLTNYLKKVRGKDVDLSGDNSQAALRVYRDLVKKLVHAYNAPKIGKELNEQIGKFLQSIDVSGTDAGFDFNDQSIMNADVVGLFSRAFAELEHENIMEKLVAGLHIPGDSFHQGLLKYAHHQDARIRSRFIKDAIARDTAVHLQGFLERGFDGASGRNGYTVANKKAEKAIGDAAKKVGKNAMDHAVGYILAQLNGLQDANGLTTTQALGKWMEAYKKGHSDLLSLDRAQRNHFTGRFAGVKRFFNANHVDMVRDVPLAKEIARIIRESRAADNFATVRPGLTTAEGQEESAQEVISQIRKALLFYTKNPAAVEEYADTIHKTLRDAYNATAVNRAVLSKPPGKRNEINGRIEDYDPWKHDGVDPHQKTYSSVPVRLGYAANPDSKEIQSEKPGREGRFIPDPADVVAIKDSSFYGGYGRHEENKNGSSVLRPMHLNGISGPLGVLEDSIYRNNVTPNYEILRRLLGKVKAPDGIPRVDKAMMIPSSLYKTPEGRKALPAWKTAVASVAQEIENNIFNDSQQGVVNTQFAQATQFLASVFVVRALSSVQQLWNQTLPPVTFYVIKKLATGQVQEASDFLRILYADIASKVSNPGSIFAEHEGRDEFHHRVAQYTKNVSPYVHFRGLDGQDVAKDQLKGQLRYGDSAVKTRVGKLIRDYQNVGEKALDITIGSGERLVARAMFMAELMSELRRADVPNPPVDAVDMMNRFPAGKIPVVANEMARIKVSDMMGQSDTSKKSKLFQQHSSSPVWSTLLKSMVRFSNHTATTSSNLTAFLPGLMSGDQRTKQDAWENAIGTIGQNVMFQFTKVHTLIPLLAYAFFMANGDDDDKAQKKAQKLADSWLASNEKSNPLAGFLKDFAFGSNKQLFQDWKDPDAAQASAAADLSSKVGMELLQAIPALGVLFGYSPISQSVKPVMNSLAEEGVSTATKPFVKRGNKSGIPVGEAWYEPDAIGINSGKQGAIETVMGLTAPSSVLYDAGEAASNTVRGSMSKKADAMDVALYALSEAIPFLRDYRSARTAEMREALKDRDNRRK